jgi:UTP-glucose-1-phosphate uridylyltransferase
MKDVAIKPKIVLTDEEKKRLVDYFNVLIEMDFELKKLSKTEKKHV